MMDLTKEIHGKQGEKLSPMQQRVLNHLEKRGSITGAEALGMYGLASLAQRICELRKLGYDIKSEMVERFNKYSEKVHVAKYVLMPNEAATGNVAT